MRGDLVLREIIKEQARYCVDTDVRITRNMPWVEIIDLTGTHEDIFLQGEAAELFIKDVDAAMEAADLDEETCAFAQAKQHIECNWL